MGLSLKTFLLQQIRILLPQWVKSNFFDIFINYLILEESNRITEALSLFMIQSSEVTQRLLWVADFFQIVDIQRFLISEVIIPKLDSRHVLSYLSDVTKKLRNFKNAGRVDDDPTLEIWTHFHEQLIIFLGTNLPEILQDQ